MKDLKTYIVEAIKPPRLSAKNRDLWAPKPLDEEEVMEWLVNNCDIEGKIEIVDGKINVKGNVEFNTDIKELPYPFREVTGYFDCEGCKKLKSLKNSPQKVGGYFDCSKCKSLTSLEGAPEYVGSSFDCEGCKKLKSLKNSPQKVGGYFDCSKCKSLTSLEGASEYVGSSFYCSQCNNLTSLEGAPKEVGNNFICHDCGKKFTEEDIRKVSKVKGSIMV